MTVFEQLRCDTATATTVRAWRHCSTVPLIKLGLQTTLCPEQDRRVKRRLIPPDCPLAFSKFGKKRPEKVVEIRQIMKCFCSFGLIVGHCTVGEIRFFCPMGVLGVFI